MKILPVSLYCRPKGKNIQTYTIKNENLSPAFVSANFKCLNTENYKANFLSRISFEGVPRNQSHFELKTIEGLNCPCCGKVMMTSKQQEEFVNNVVGKKGIQLEEALLSAEQFYRPVETAVVKRIISIARQKTNLSLSQILKQEALTQKRNLEKRQIRIIENQLRNISKGLKKDTKADVTEVLDKAISDIKNSSESHHFRTSDLFNGLKEIEERRGGEAPFKELYKVISNMPNSHTSTEAFFVKFSRKSESEIASRLVSPMLVTTEHIDPKSDNGSDSTDNYILMCSTCNSTRQSIPYPVWLKRHPNMVKGLQEYLNAVDQIIKEGRIPNAGDYHTYIKDIIRTFARETNGELILKRPDNQPVDFSEQKKKPKLSPEEKRQKLYNDAMSLYDELKELKQLKEDLKDDDEFHMIVEHSRLSEVLRQLLQDKKAKSIALTEQKRAVATAENSLSKATKDKEKEKKIKAAQEKVEVEKAKLDEAKAAYNEAAKIADQKGIELEKLAKRMTFPGDVQKQIEKIEGNLAQMRSLLIKIGSFETNPLNQYQIRNLIHDIQDEIEQRERERELLSQKVDLNSPENISSKKKYTKLKTRLDMIDSVNPDEFKRLFKGFSEEPSFILKLARKPVQDELNELVNSSNAARYVHMGYVIDDLKKDISQKEVEVQAARDREYELYKLKSQYNALKVHGSEDVLNKKLEGLRAKKAILDKKFGAINIDEQIEMAETRANELMQKYTESL